MASGKITFVAMKQSARVIFIIALLAVYYYFRGQVGASRTIKYQGETFNLSKAYASYEDYKDDPNNLATNEIARIEHAVTNAAFPSSFRDFEGFSRAAFELKFPGYGLTSLGWKQQSDGSTCSVISVEIPMRDRDRYLVGRAAGGPVTVIDDFVMGESNQIHSIKIDGTNIMYYDAAGKLVRSKKCNPCKSEPFSWAMRKRLFHCGGNANLCVRSMIRGRISGANLRCGLICFSSVRSAARSLLR